MNQQKKLFGATCSALLVAALFAMPCVAQPGPAEWSQLKKEVIAAQRRLDRVVSEARTAGHSTDRAEVSQTVVKRFLSYAQFDRDNPQKIQQAIDKHWWKDRVPEGYSRTLPFTELKDALKVADHAIAELREQLAGTKRLAPPVDLSKGELIQGERNFEIDGKTVFPSSFVWMPEEPDLLNAFGRMGGIYHTPADVWPDGSVAVQNWRADADSLREQNKRGQSPHVFFLGYNLASWQKEKHPEVLQGGREFMLFDTDSPLTRKWCTQMFQSSLPHTTKASGGARMYLVANEPNFATREGGWHAEKRVSDNTLEKYRSWLERRYADDIDKLNKTYGSHYAGFDEAREAMAARLPIPVSLQGGPVWYDWARFNMTRVNDWFLFLKQAIQAEDPSAQITIKILGGQLINDWRDDGMDMEYLTRLQGVPGADFYTQPAGMINLNVPKTELDWRDRYTIQWVVQSMGLDFAKSIGGEKPFYDSEWGGFSSKFRDYAMRRDYVQAALWLAYTHGMGATNAWVWCRNKDGDFEGVNSAFVGEVVTQPVALDAYGRTFKELNAHGDSIAELTGQQRKFFIYYTEDSAIQDNTYTDKLQAVYESLKMLNLPVGFATAKTIRRLDSSCTIIVPPTKYTSDATLSRLEKFPGRVVLVDPHESFRKTEHGATRKRPRLKPFATSPYGEVFSMADRLGKALEPLIVGPPLQVRITDAKSKPAYGVLVKQSLNESTGAVTLSLINVAKEERRVTIGSRGGPGSVVDLIDGVPAEAEQVLAPYAVRLLRVAAR